MARFLGTDLSDPDVVPYFCWDDRLTVGQLREKLSSASEPERIRLLGKILREARDRDVWIFTTPRDVAREWPKLLRHLGRRRAFWRYVLDGWREAGLLAG